MRQAVHRSGDVVICIPSKRPPPIKTIAEFNPQRRVLVVSDPSMVRAHVSWVASEGLERRVTVVEGREGMVPQSWECYRAAHRAGYPYYFRVDDDLNRKSFPSKDGKFLSIESVLVLARAALDVLRVSLAGFVNTTRRDWMSDGFRRTFGLIHGGAHCCISAEDPSPFLDLELPCFEDVYRSLAHRVRDGAVGRVQSVGIDKRSAGTPDTNVPKTAENVTKARRIILAAFPGMITCEGTRTIHAGKQVIANWRFRRGSTFVAGLP